MRGRWLLGAMVAALASCDHELPSQLPLGTWGGADVGLVVSAEAVHVHLGCTRGDIAGRVPIDPSGAFSVGGLHNVDAFPVDLGIVHPARYDGRLLADDRVTIEVTLTDTGQRLGPATAFLGREPALRECPICQ